MKINRCVKLSMLFLVPTLFLAACGNKDNGQEQNLTQMDKAVNNAKEIKSVIFKNNPKFKLAESSTDTAVVGQNVELMSDSGDGKTTTYVFSDQNKGISVEAFAINNNLNKTQAELIETLIGIAKNEKYSLQSMAQSIREKNDFNKKVEVAYVVFDNLKVMDGKNPKIQGKLSAYYRIDGKLKKETLNVDWELEKENGNAEKINKEDRKESLDGDFLNKNLPKDNRGGNSNGQIINNGI